MPAIMPDQETALIASPVDLNDLPIRLRVAAILFLAHNGSLMAPSAAADAGDGPAEAFLEALRELEIVPRDLWKARRGQFGRAGVRTFRLDEARPLPYVYPYAPGDEIVVAQVGSYFFDWTAARLGIDAPFPLVWHDLTRA